jgi:hypothetical protein
MEARKRARDIQMYANRYILAAASDSNLFYYLFRLYGDLIECVNSRVGCKNVIKILCVYAMLCRLAIKSAISANNSQLEIVNVIN